MFAICLDGEPVETTRRIEAIRGTSIPASDMKPNPIWRDPNTARHLTCGEYGCAMSHLQVWQTIVDEKIPMSIVLEDDAQVLRSLTDVAKEIPWDSEFVYLGRKKISGGEEKRYKESSPLVHAAFSYWTVAYAVSLSGAEKLIRGGLQDNVYPVDEYIAHMAGVNPYDKELIPQSNGEILKTLAFEPPVARPAFGKCSSTFFSPAIPVKVEGLTLVTVATSNTSGLRRFTDSANTFGFSPCVLGMGTVWRGGDVIRSTGGGQKIVMFRAYLENLAIPDDEIVIFSDSYDVLVNNHAVDVLNAYKTHYPGSVLFSCEAVCWPDSSLADHFPPGPPHRFLNSGGIMGPKGAILDLLRKTIVNDEADDQREYTKLFLENKPKCVLDHECRIFLCLSKSYGTIPGYEIKERSSYLTFRRQRAAFIHGNGPSKDALSYIANRIYENSSVYGTRLTPEVNCKRITLIIEGGEQGFSQAFRDGIAKQTVQFESVILVGGGGWESASQASTLADASTKVQTPWVFYASCDAVLTRADTVEECLRNAGDRDAVVAPLLVRRNSLFSNFWGATDSKGYYARSEDYMDIVAGKLQGRYAMPYVWRAFVAPSSLFEKAFLDTSTEDVDMFFNRRLRESAHLAYLVAPQESFGYLRSEEKYGIFSDNILGGLQCSGDEIFSSAVLPKATCDRLIELAEKKNAWSGGGAAYYDERLGAKENHPTQDVYLKTLGIGEEWDRFVMDMIAPLVQEEFGYATKTVQLSFIVKYTPDSQSQLGEHHDSSSYSVNICLNDDFEGGGVKFKRQRRFIPHRTPGEMILHPGRVTHIHCAPPVTSGTRYVLVSFIN